MNPDEFESTTSYAYDPPEVSEPPRKEICWIVAGSRAEFDEYVKKKKQMAGILREELMVEYRYVSGVDSIRGCTITKGFYIGSYKQRPDIQAITDQIKIAKLFDEEALKQAVKKINGG